MHLLLLEYYAIENTYKDAFITSYHIISVVTHAFTISYSMIMHIGSIEEITLLEFNEEEEGDQQETPQAIALGEEEQTPEELLECLDPAPPFSSKVSPGAF